MTDCATCGNRDYLCQQCKMDALEDRLGLPSEHFDADAGIVCWVQDLDETWHASMYFEGSSHVAACGEIFETPVADVRDDPRRLAEAATCDDCEAALEDDGDDAAVDGGFEKASEIATDGGLEEVFRRETIIATDDGMAIGEDAVPEDDHEVRTDGGQVSSGTVQTPLTKAGYCRAYGLRYPFRSPGDSCPLCPEPLTDLPGTSSTETKRDGGAR